MKITLRETKRYNPQLQNDVLLMFWLWPQDGAIHTQASFGKLKEVKL